MNNTKTNFEIVEFDYPVEQKILYHNHKALFKMNLNKKNID